MKLLIFVQAVARLHHHPSLRLKGEGIEGRGRRSRLRALVATIAATATICLAGYWEFEQVDSGSLGSYVAIDKMSDGTIWLAYVNSDSAIRLAHKDSVWEYEDLDTAMVRPGFPSWQTWPPFSFDVGPGDVVGVVGLGRLAEFRDSGWSSEQLPMPMTDMAFIYDSASQPSLTFKDSLWRGCLGLKTDSGWDTDIVFTPSGNTMGFSLTRPAWHRNGNCALIEAEGWSMGGLIDGYYIDFYRRDSDVWTLFGGKGGLDGGGCGLAVLADGGDRYHTFWSASDPYGSNELVCDGVWMDYATSVASACLDDSDRVQCVWVRGDTLKFATPRHETWVVQDTGSPVWCDITTDNLAQPVVAFCRDDGSIWIAHGVGIVGLSDEQGGSEVQSLPRAASIVSGVLVLGELGTQSELPEPNSVVSRAALLDISGRKVMDLHSGANDVAALAPGVYFVREGGGSREQGAAGVRKVVVAK